MVFRDEQKRKEYAELLHELTSFIERLDFRIHDMHLESKAQRRRTFNTYRIKENIIIRSNFRLGELTGRRGIEAGALVKGIRRKLHRFSRAVKGGKRLDINQVKMLLKYCRMEAKDLENVFLFVIHISERVEQSLNRIKAVIASDAKLRGLTADYFIVRKRLDILRKDIQTQHRRLDNQFKKKGFTPNAQIQREIKAAA